MKALKISKPPDDAIRELLLSLFERKKIGGVFALTKTNTRNYAYTLITNKDLLKNITPTIPLMPTNAGKLLSRLTMIEPVSTPIAVVVRPCELRALFELVKLEQAKLDNLLFISFTCSGVYPTRFMIDGIENKLKAYWENIRTGHIPQDLRESCRMCENFVPDNADILLTLMEQDTGTESTLFIKTEKGKQFLEDKSGQLIEAESESKKIESMRNKRIDEKERIFADLKTEDFGIKGLTEIFGRCINCHACSKACPVCYCKLCYFESSESEYSSSTLEKELNKRGAVRLPADTVFYHIGRLIHVGITCVACGMCSDACPTNIPISTIFAKLGKRVQQLFDYVPGRNIEEPIPISIFNKEEFEEVEE
jgi:formate dehydrogenase subunit beta